MLTFKLMSRIKLYLFFVLILYNDNFHRAKQVQENRKLLIPIIQCVILCGREEIPVRGHRDFGTFNIEGLYIFIVFQF